MKYLSLFLLLILMSISWASLHETSPISEDVHIGIQNDLQRVITEFIEENLPTSKNLKFERMWTEPTKKDQVKASFIYSFEDANEEVGAAKVEIDGYAILNRKSSDEDSEFWSFDELYILNNHVQFKESVMIKVNDSEEQ